MKIPAPVLSVLALLLCSALQSGCVHDNLYPYTHGKGNQTITYPDGHQLWHKEGEPGNIWHGN